MKQSVIATPHKTVEDRLMESRIVWLNGGVSDETAYEISSKLLVLSGQDIKKDIFFFINSPGGSVTSGCMLADTMNLIPNDVVTIGTGMAASMGQFLLTQGAPGKRFATPLLRVLLHQPLGGAGGSADDILIEAELINDMKKVLAGETAKRTGHSLEKVIEDGDRDKWFNSSESLDYGFVDHIVSGNLSEIMEICAKVDGQKGTKAYDQYLKKSEVKKTRTRKVAAKSDKGDK